MIVDEHFDKFVCAVIASVCDREVSTVIPETTLDDLSIDSLILIAILAQVETAYELELAPEGALILLRAQSVADFIEDLKRLVRRSITDCGENVEA